MSKNAIDLMPVNINKIIISEKFNYNEDCFNTLLVTKKVKLLGHYVLICLK